MSTPDASIAASAADRCATFSWLRLALGTLLGVAAVWAAFEAAHFYPLSVAPDEPVPVTAPPLPTSPVDVSLSFVETGVAPTIGNHVVQGLGLTRVPVTFRAALIRHPSGTLLFGTGISAQHNERHVGFKVGTPFGASQPGTAVGDALRSVRIDRVILPTMRWYNLGGIWSLDAATPILVGSGELSTALGRSWPWRFGYDPDWSRELESRIQGVSLGAGGTLGGRKSEDLFGDGSVVAVAYKGSSLEEIALLVTLGSGKRVLLVGDSVLHEEQVTQVRLTYQAMSWFQDRNRMQAVGVTQRLSAVQATLGIDVIPMLDGTQQLPRYPESWR
jgi:hypothetical protein